MSMYTALLEAALSEQRQSSAEPTTGEGLAKLLRCRSRLEVGRSSHTGTGWVPTALADQLAYDVALIRFARQLGIACDVSTFDPPQPARTRLEYELADRGVRLEELDEHRPRRSVQLWRRP